MALSKDETTSALETLAIFGNTIARIHGNQVNSDLRMLQGQRDREHEKAMQDDRQNFQANQSRIAYEREVFQEFGDLPKLENGEFDWSKADISKTITSRTKNYERIVERLEAADVDVEGLDETGIIEVNKAYRLGEGKFLTSSQGQFSPDISSMAGGDVSPGFWTDTDIVDFENAIENNRIAPEDDTWSSYAPTAIQQLESMGMMEGIVIDTTAGYLRISKDDEHLVKATIAGMKKGAKGNVNYKPTADYLNWQNEQIEKGVLFSNAVTGGSQANLATSE